MTKRLALAVALFAAAAAHAATRVRIEPPPPYHADETVRIHVTRDAGSLSEVEVSGDNISITEQSPGVWLGTFYASSGTGQIVVRAPGPIEGPARLPFTLLPALMQPWTEPEAEFQRLRAAGRPVVFVHTELETPNPIAGQSVRVNWALYRPYGMPRPVLRATGSDLPKGFEVYGSNTESLTPLSGAMMIRVVLASATLPAQEPGHVTIPGIKFAVDELQRLSSTLEFDVRRLPADAAGLPVGSFVMNCQSQQSTYWPVAIVEVRVPNAGPADADAVRGLRFPTTAYAIVAAPLEGRPGQFGIVAHSRDISEIPQPALRFFDPKVNQVQEIRCTNKLYAKIDDSIEPADLKPHLYENSRPRSEASLAPVLPAPNREEVRIMFERGRIVAFVLAGLGVIGLLAAFRT